MDDAPRNYGSRPHNPETLARLIELTLNDNLPADDDKNIKLSEARDLVLFSQQILGREHSPLHAARGEYWRQISDFPAAQKALEREDISDQEPADLIAIGMNLDPWSTAERPSGMSSRVRRTSEASTVRIERSRGREPQ